MHWSVGNKQTIYFNSDTIAMLKQQLYKHFDGRYINIKLLSHVYNNCEYTCEYFKVFISFRREEDENLFLLLVADGLEI
jgi:hypothetical protein